MKKKIGIAVLLVLSLCSCTRNVTREEAQNLLKEISEADRESDISLPASVIMDVQYGGDTASLGINLTQQDNYFRWDVQATSQGKIVFGVRWLYRLGGQTYVAEMEDSVKRYTLLDNSDGKLSPYIRLDSIASEAESIANHLAGFSSRPPLKEAYRSHGKGNVEVDYSTKETDAGSSNRIVNYRYVFSESLLQSETITYDSAEPNRAVTLHWNQGTAIYPDLKEFQFVENASFGKMAGLLQGF